MVVAKRERREKPTEIEERKVRGPETDPQVKQTALLASPIYIGQAQGEDKKTEKEEPKGQGSLSHTRAHMHSFFFSLSPLCVCWVSMPPSLEYVFSFIF